MFRSLARFYVLFLAAFILIGLVIFAAPNKIGFILGAKDKRKDAYDVNIPKSGVIKVLVVSPQHQWDLLQYLCKSLEECQYSEFSGKWWSTVSGGPTNQDGHEVYIEKSEDWRDYRFLKLMVKQTGLQDKYLKTDQGADSFIIELDDNIEFGGDVKFF